MTRLRMQGVCKRFGATVALDAVDLEVRAGEVHAIVGENGAGKSTLMKVLSGAYRPDRGAMWLDGRPYRPRRPLDGRRHGIAMIYQELALAPHLSIQANILLGMEPVRGPLVRRAELRRRACAAMRAIGLGHLAPETPLARVAPAERQLVEIARAVAIGCRVLVLDEPTSSLSRVDIERLFGLVRRLREDGHAIVYISHFLEEVKAISDRYTVLRDGQTVGTGVTAETPTEAIIARMVGRTVADLYPRRRRIPGTRASTVPGRPGTRASTVPGMPGTRASTVPGRPGEAVLELADVAGARLPRRASLRLHRGEILGVAGLIGAGRTELVRAVFGLDPVRRGTVRVGAYTGGADAARRWRQGVGMVSENRRDEGLATGLSVADNLTLSRLPAFVRPMTRDRATARWVRELDIRCQGPRQRARDLSGGNQQKLAVARLLYHDVDVLLLDEPTRGIDVGSKAELYRLLDALAVGDATRGVPPKAILMVSSYLPELLGVCDRIAVMARGVLGPARLVGELDAHALMAEATLADPQPTVRQA